MSLDRPTKSNLRFLIGLRHEIEHHRSAGSDNRFSGRYLACCLNYERYICQLFGSNQSLGESAAFTVQFRDLVTTAAPEEAVEPLPSNVAKYLSEFDADVPDEDMLSPYFRRRFLFVPIATGTKAQADEVIPVCAIRVGTRHGGRRCLQTDCLERSGTSETLTH